MTDAEGLVEAVAEALAPFHGEDKLEVARAALSAISAAGWAVVPREATDKMRTEGSIALNDHKVQPMAKVWEAMVDAAPKVPL